MGSDHIVEREHREASIRKEAKQNVRGATRTEGGKGMNKVKEINTNESQEFVAGSRHMPDDHEFLTVQLSALLHGLSQHFPLSGKIS